MEFKLYNTFEEYHPVVNFVYFIGVILFSMIFNQPIFLIISFLGAFLYSVMLKGNAGLKFNIKWLIPMMIMIIIMNPLFNHRGVTVLFYLNDKPITLEAFLYGISMATMIISIVLWFSCYSTVVSSEKFIYIFSKKVQSIALLISMTLSFVPKFKEQLKLIRKSQRSIGRDVTCGGILDRAKNGCTIISILITWALENGVYTAESMRARGYGLPRRSSFSLYKIHKRDKIALIEIISLIIILFVGYLYGRCTMIFYPSIEMNKIVWQDIIVYIAYMLLMFFPIIIEIKEGIKWSLLKSRI